METRDELFAAAEEMGEELTKWKLRDWRTRRGLLPSHAYRVGHGKWGKGSTTYYPDGTVRQLEWLIFFKRRSPNLNAVGWKLWGMGFPVVDFVQKHLPKLFKEREDKVKGELKAYEEGRLDSIVYSASTMRLDREFDKMRRRVPEGHFPRLVRFILELFSGDVSRSLFERGPRLGRLIEKAIGSSNQKWSDADLPQIMDVMAEIYDVEANRRAAERATDQELLDYQREALWGWRRFAEEADIERPCPLPPLAYAFWFAVRARDTRIGRFVEQFRQSRRWKAMVRLTEMRR